MNNIKTIENLYFEEKKSLTEISEILNITVGYISKILKNNDKYFEEKQRRKRENLIQRRKVQKDMIYKGRRERSIDLTYAALQNSHEQASRELSKSSKLGNDAIRKWCNSAYKYNSKKGRYEFDAGNSVKPADLPQYIKL